MKTPSISSFQKQTFLVLSFFYIFFSPMVCGQVPQGIPKDMGPVDFSSTSNIIIYIVLPVVVLIVFFFWKSAVKRRKKEDEDKI
jgi:heme/copper-type cytochrome/quinol oxidase subunit 2